MPNPIVPQGSINITQGSVSFPSYPSLNVTLPFLGAGGINLTFQGRVTDYHGTMTGAVTSPNVYVLTTIGIHLLRTQSLSDAFKTQLEFDARLGPIIVRPDLSAGTGLEPFDFDNGAITGISALTFSAAGNGPEFMIELEGVYAVNGNLFNG